MYLWRAILVTGLASLVLASCCVADWIDDDDEVSPSVHSEGQGSDT